MPVLNWDTRAPVDWTGSVFEETMSPGRGESQVAAALKKTPTIPESHPSLTEESRSPRAAPDDRSTPERGKGAKTKRPPPRERPTPDKTKEAVKS